MVVERLLAADGKSKHDLGRERFVDRVWEWKEQSGNRISQQLRRLGSSVDWSRERFTMDDGLSAAGTPYCTPLFLISRFSRARNGESFGVSATL